MSIDDIKEVSVEEQTQAASSAVAVGLVATPDTSDAVARAILRARTHGYEVFVAHDGHEDAEAVQFAEALGATVVFMRAADPDMTVVQQGLATAAEQHGYSNLIVNPDVTQRIDFERSEALLNEETFCVDAATERASPTDAAAPDVLVAIPAYNEANTIASVVEASRAVADQVLVVDDGSDDETAQLAAEMGAIVVEHEGNRGYGAALQTAFIKADDCEAKHLVIIDADGQHDPADIPQLVEAQQATDAELVIGSRFAGDGDTDAPLYRRFGLGVVNLLTNLSLGVVRPRSRVQDTQSGFRAYDRTAIESLAESTDVGDRMSASTDILYHAHENSFAIEEVGTTITYDVESASSHNPVEHGLTLVKNILYTIERKRPVTVLGVPGFLSALLGVGFAYWTISNFLNSGTFSVSLALISSVFVLIGIFASFTGIILHALNTQVIHRLEALDQNHPE
jgi:glycosyltransferase involved in cell wall biosynthesis